MPKTAQEWKDLLNLETLPDDEYLMLLNAIEGQEFAEGGEDGPSPHWMTMTEKQLVQTIMAATVGEAFKQLRERQGLTMQQTAERLGVTSGRVAQIEDPSSNLNLLTVTRTASRIGCRVKLVIEPEAGGPSITVPLHAI